MELPRSREAVVSEQKITGYLLSETHPVGKAKAKFFKSLEFSQDDISRLREALVSIAVFNEVTEAVSTPFGMKYVIDGEIVSPYGIRSIIRTIWILETGDEFPFLVTAYPADTGNKGEI